MFSASNVNQINKVERDEQLGLQLRQVFLKFFVEIFGDYQEYTSSIDDTAYFNSESFLNNIPKEYHNFYLSILIQKCFMISCKEMLLLIQHYISLINIIINIV